MNLLEEVQQTLLPSSSQYYSVDIARVDCGREAALAQQFKLSEFPTLMLFRSGTDPIVYRGEAMLHDIVNFVHRWTTKPPLLELTSEQEVNALIFGAESSTQEIKILGIFSDFDQVPLELFRNCARAFLDVATFAYTSDVQTMARLNTTSVPAILIFRNQEAQPRRYRGSFDQSVNLLSWLRHNTLPLIHELRSSNFIQIVGTGVPVVVLFVDDHKEITPSKTTNASENGTLAQRSGVLELLWETVNDVNEPSRRMGHYAAPLIFAVAHSATFWRFGENLGVALDRLPDLVILDGPGRTHHTWGRNVQITTKLTSAAVTKFCRAFLRGDLGAGQPTSRNSGNPVLGMGHWALIEPSMQKVIPLNTSEYHRVMKASGDVFVYFHSPWCAFCASFMQTWNRVATAVFTETSAQRLTLATYDVHQNDPPHELQISSLPKFVLFPHGESTHAAVEYTGPQAVSGIIAFLRSNCTYAWKQLEQPAPTDDETGATKANEDTREL